MRVQEGIDESMRNLFFHISSCFFSFQKKKKKSFWDEYFAILKSMVAECHSKLYDLHK